MALLTVEHRLMNIARDKVDNFLVQLDDTVIQMPSDAGRAFPDGELRPQTIQIVERLQFVRECLGTWLRLADAGINVVGGPDTGYLDPLAADQVSAVVVTGYTLQQSGAWFEQELAWLGAHRSSMRILAVVPDELADHSEEWIERFGLSGFILSSSSPDVACAVLRLVIAGVTHFPRFRSRGWPEVPNNIELKPSQLENHLSAKLTMRERDVVYHVGRGYPNKMIARELNMSLSTVKAHMHNIIQKLNVKNRTEVALAARSG